jgi:ribose transport system ATP-binding protein
MSESAEPRVGIGPAPTATEAAPFVEPAPVLEMHGIRKSFNKVEVLHGVDLVALPGEIHGLVGANGAGKSTLMKILNGVYQADEGMIVIDGMEVAYADPLGARAHGIAMVYQEFSLVASMTVAQNLFLTREPRTAGVLIDDAQVEKRAHTIFAELGVDIDPRAILGSLPVGRRQLVEIAKALSTDARILILDEPTASLSHTEIEILFGLMRRLRERGIAILFISHHLQELSAVCDRVTVLRDGNVSRTASPTSSPRWSAATCPATRWRERNRRRSARLSWRREASAGRIASATSASRSTGARSSGSRGFSAAAARSY